MLDTTVYRDWDSSISFYDRGVLRIGGVDLSNIILNSTEVIPIDGSSTSPGPITVRHGPQHCAMKISEDVVVLTGGQAKEEVGGAWSTLDQWTNVVLDLVTEYRLDDGKETALTPMTQRRRLHACGAYKDTDNRQVSGVVKTRLFPD